MLRLLADLLFGRIEPIPRTLYFDWRGQPRWVGRRPRSSTLYILSRSK